MNMEDNILQDNNESKENTSSQKDNGQHEVNRQQEDSGQQDDSKLKGDSSSTPKTDKLKGFLESNKIYFDTIIPLVVPIIALVLSIISMVTSYNANRISEELRDITKQQVLPVIDIASVYDDNGKLTAVQVFNNGGVIDDVNVIIYPYIDFVVHISAGSTTVSRRGVCPVKIIMDKDSEKGNIAGEQYEKGVFKELAPHTKSNMLYEVSNTDLMEHVSEVMKYVMDKDSCVYFTDDDQIIIKDVVGDKETQSEIKEEFQCFIRWLSLEYIMEITYKNGVDSEQVTERYRVVTGCPTYFMPNISKVESDMWSSDIFETVSTIDPEKIEVTGNTDSIEKDINKLFEFVITCANKREYILSHWATATF